VSGAGAACWNLLVSRAYPHCHVGVSSRLMLDLIGRPGPLVTVSQGRLDPATLRPQALTPWIQTDDPPAAVNRA